MPFYLVYNSFNIVKLSFKDLLLNNKRLEYLNFKSCNFIQLSPKPYSNNFSKMFTNEYYWIDIFKLITKN